jgi:hypothetical protein
MLYGKKVEWPTAEEDITHLKVFKRTQEYFCPFEENFDR